VKLFQDENARRSVRAAVSKETGRRRRLALPASRRHSSMGPTHGLKTSDRDVSVGTSAACRRLPLRTRESAMARNLTSARLVMSVVGMVSAMVLCAAALFTAAHHLAG